MIHRKDWDAESLAKIDRITLTIQDTIGETTWTDSATGRTGSVCAYGMEFTIDGIKGIFRVNDSLIPLPELRSETIRFIIAAECDKHSRQAA